MNHAWLTCGEAEAGLRSYGELEQGWSASPDAPSAPVRYLVLRATSKTGIFMGGISVGDKSGRLLARESRQYMGEQGANAVILNLDLILAVSGHTLAFPPV